MPRVRVRWKTRGSDPLDTAAATVVIRRRDVIRLRAVDIRASGERRGVESFRQFSSKRFDRGR